MFSMLNEMSMENLIFLVIMCFLASIVDAIAGGGGLISLPAFMSTGFPIHMVMGTHKLASVASSIGSSLKFFTSGKTNFELLKYLIPLNLLGAGFGVYVLNMIDEKILEPLVIVLLLVMVVYTVANKGIGAEDNYKGVNKKTLMYGMIMASVIGFYNGFFGPGTGSFLLFAFVKIFGMEFISASGNAKILNLSGNLASTFLFIYYGRVNYAYSLVLGITMFIGGQVGAKLAITKGSKFIKPFFLVVTSITLGKMLYEMFL